MATVIITGVSRGLGAELFTQLHGAGHRVVGIGRSFTESQHELARTQPERVVLAEADLTEPARLPDRAAFRSLVDGADRVVLVHNAGVVEPIGAVGDLPAEKLADAVAVNLTAPMVLTNAFLAARPDAAAATVLFLSSGAAHRPVDGWSVYSCAKRGGEAFFEAVAAQYADEPRIRVASVNPGVMDTGMQAAIREAAASDAWFPDRGRFVALHADGALPDPAEVARTLIRDHILVDTGPEQAAGVIG